MTGLVFIIALIYPQPQPRQIDLASPPSYYAPVQTVYGGQTATWNGVRWINQRTQVNSKPANVPGHVWVQFDNITEWSWELYRTK